jgi:protein ImuA
MPSSATATMSAPQNLHPSLWLASQLAQSSTRCIDTGFAALSAQLPGNGWPTGNLIDLLVQQPGSGEMRLLGPALAKVSGAPIVLLQPPHSPQSLALAALGLNPSQLVWVRCSKSSDALWAAEQILRSGSCGALLFWQTHARGETLRRLHLAAQSGDTLFCMLRPLTAAQDASPALLRVAVRPAPGGVDLEFVKRRGPQRDTPLFLPLLSSTLMLRPAAVAKPVSVPVPVPVSFPIPAPTPASTRILAPAPALSVLPELVG